MHNEFQRISQNVFCLPVIAYNDYSLLSKLQQEAVRKEWTKLMRIVVGLRRCEACADEPEFKGTERRMY